MSKSDRSRHKTHSKDSSHTNANKEPLGTRKSSYKKDTILDSTLLLNTKWLDSSKSKDTIGCSLKEIRNQVSTDNKADLINDNSYNASVGVQSEQHAKSKKPSIKDRLGTRPLTNYKNDNEYTAFQTYNHYSTNNPQDGSEMLVTKRHPRGATNSVLSGFRGRGETRGRRGNNAYQGQNQYHQTFPDSRSNIYEPYPVPIVNDSGQKMRPRAARRAAAQLQSLFDSSLTYSSSEMVTTGNNGIGNAMITPAIQNSLEKVIHRRKYASKNCEECDICSNVLFQVCHPHISTVKLIRSQRHQMLLAQEKRMVEANNLSLIETDTKIWCAICRRYHHIEEIGSIIKENCIDSTIKLSNEETCPIPPGEEETQSHFDWKSFGTHKRLERRKLVMSSSELNNLWTTSSYNHEAKFHVDFDCIIDGEIHDVHASFLYQYLETTEPMNVVISCGTNNIAIGDSAWSIIFQLNSFVRSILQHSEDNKHKVANRIIICPLLYAPKYCDNRLAQEANMLQKVIEVNRWIHKFNRDNTGLKISLDEIGVLQIPNGLCGVQHDYGKWSESAWEDKINLTQEAKAKLSKELLEVFETLEHQSYMLGKYRDGKQNEKETLAVQNDYNEIPDSIQKNAQTNIVMTVKKDDKTCLKPGVEEDDSDEDLSYLL